MSLKAIKELLSQYEDMIGTSTSEIGAAAQAEIAALEKAAKALNEAGWLTVIPEEPHRTQSEARAAQLLATIAKEAE